VRGLEPHERVRKPGDLAHRGRARPGAPGQEAQEQERAHGQATPDQRGEHGGRTRQTRDRDPLLEREHHQPKARVGDEWRPRLADEGQVRAAAQVLEQRRCALLLAVVVVAQHPGADAERAQQLADRARVLGGDQMDARQCRDRAR